MPPRPLLAAILGLTLSVGCAPIDNSPAVTDSPAPKPLVHEVSMMVDPRGGDRLRAAHCLDGSPAVDAQGVPDCIVLAAPSQVQSTPASACARCDGVGLRVPTAGTTTRSLPPWTGEVCFCEIVPRPGRPAGSPSAEEAGSHYVARVADNDDPLTSGCTFPSGGSLVLDAAALPMVPYTLTITCWGP